MDASERIVNLALYIASARRAVSAEEIRANVSGYPPGQDDDAFGRMFERDKERLREAGLVLQVDRGEGAERYRLDAAATFSSEVVLDPREVMELRAAGAAMLADPSFPFADDLRFALAKIMAGAEAHDLPSAPVACSLTADEDPGRQGEVVAELSRAVVARKAARFGYTDVNGAVTRREVEPWGLYAREGRWYLVALDRGAGAARVFAVPRMREIETEQRRPKTPDFQRPEGFDIRAFMRMPFQFGSARVEALVRMTGQAASRAGSLTAGQGSLSREPDGSVLWRVPVADERQFAVWVAERGPGIAVLEPASVARLLSEGLERVADAHA